MIFFPRRASYTFLLCAINRHQTDVQRSHSKAGWLCKGRALLARKPRRLTGGKLKKKIMIGWMRVSEAAHQQALIFFSMSSPPAVPPHLPPPSSLFHLLHPLVALSSFLSRPLLLRPFTPAARSERAVALPESLRQAAPARLHGPIRGPADSSAFHNVSNTTILSSCRWTLTRWSAR